MSTLNEDAKHELALLVSVLYASTTYGRIATVNVFFAAKKIAIDLNRKVSGCTTRRRGKPLYVCMYLMIGKGQIAQKRPYWGENRPKSKIYG